MKKKISSKDYSSFRDPSGFVFYDGGKVFRKINKCYFDNYDLLMNSGLYGKLVDEGLLISHTLVSRNEDEILLEVDKVPFISYPYEWSFSMYQEAALVTLKINVIALEYNMILKDASAYNIQFINGRAVLIDTLSFIKYEENSPWGAYGQFCRHFIAPLLLMSQVNMELNSLMIKYIDGIPLQVAEDILKKRGGFFAKQHIIWQNKAIKKHNVDGKESKKVNVVVSKKSLENIHIMMDNQIRNIKVKHFNTEWEEYYSNTNYSDEAFLDKKKIILNFLEDVEIDSEDLAVDIGANDGEFSRVISDKFKEVISLDIDYNSVNSNYLKAFDNKENILPLMFDFTNPSPAIGFSLKERKSFNDRCDVRLVMALALLHHMAISNNVPFIKIAEWFASLSEYLIIEYVPKEDSKVKILLNTRNDIFDSYDIDSFEESFKEFYDIKKKVKVKSSERTMYLMVRK